MAVSGNDSGNSLPVLLSSLPTFGTLTGDRLVVPSGSGVTNYVPSRDTAPPADQVLHRDTQNALVRALIAKRQRDEKREKKRQAEEAAEKLPAKRTATGPGSSAEGSGHGLSAAELRSLTVPHLKHRLQALGLPVSGKKEELVERLLSAQHRDAAAAAAQAAQ